MNASPSAYFDNNATTAVAPEVIDAMMPYLREHYGNPSSPHAFARRPAIAITAARERVAALLHVAPSTIIFTSGGTESNALAMHAALTAQPERREVILSAVEHAAVWNWRSRLAAAGYRVHVMPVHRDGSLDLDFLWRHLSEQTALVSVMLANNETGIIYPVDEIASRVRAAGARLHTDAVQAPGKIPVDLIRLGVDFAAIGGHKLHAVKGVGALYVRDASSFAPLMPGGEQEGGLRPGTEAVPAIVALGAATALPSADTEKIAARRDAFEAWLLAEFPGVIIAGHGQPRLPNTTLALFPGMETEPLLALLDLQGVACSSGSACASGAHESSHVLAAMGLDKIPAAVVRISASRYTTDHDYARLRTALTSAARSF